MGGGAWQRGGSSCRPTTTAVGEPVVLPTITVEDVRRVGLPPSTANLQPAGGDVVLNVPVNVYAQATPVTRQVEVLGFPVTIRATPEAFTWTFGDGGTLGPTTDPGAPYPAMSTTHTYTRPGTYPITLTTTYSAEYAIAGLPFQPVAGTVDVSAPAEDVTAHEGTTVLVR
ncbi:PKD domain-containing protein [Kineococcus sp. TRM81007]|uniref:PKD domain-containing protein n=1 Tax=Kineococcus sp. TRM81007 TaxID=2925831 RepID=UPI001F5A260E|nr:PKD domain-containing protein [Kineococcus sp. TRM81007]MCI2237036.1 PKD domain-containing protein [Kineococcus sp. TRM81007]